jgi:hypothetical protein
MRPDGSYVSLCRCELDPRGLDQKQTTLPFWSIFGAGQGRLGTGKRNRSNDLDLICVHLEGRRSIQLSYGRTANPDSKAFTTRMNTVLYGLTFCRRSRRSVQLS